MPETQGKGKVNGTEKGLSGLRQWGILFLAVTIIAAYVLIFRYFYGDGGDGGSRATLRGIDGGYGEASGDSESYSDAA
jgi:hypothetical protein